MKTFVSDIIPKIYRYSKKLDNLTLLTNQHWIVLDELGQSKTVYIFRNTNELLISTNGLVEKAKWEYLGQDSILIDLKEKSFLFRHGFLDDKILALKVDSKSEYAIFVNESNFGRELNSIQAINDFLQEKYFDKPTVQSQEPKNISQKEVKYEDFSLSAKQEKVIEAIGIGLFLLVILILYIKQSQY